jgi:hypothetical protein
MKHKILHPYWRKTENCDLTKMVEVEVQGETKYGVPDGLCFQIGRAHV